MNRFDLRAAAGFGKLVWSSFHTKLAAGHINRARGIVVEQGIVKSDDMRLGVDEDLVELLQKLRVGRVIGPRGKDSVRIELRREPA